MPRIYLSPPHLSGEEQLFVKEAFESNWIAPLGPQVDAFEQEMARYAGVGSAVALSSGTAALHLALRVLGIGPGDDVLVSTLTFVASANAIAYVGARPVFVDVDPDTWVIDPERVDEALRVAAKKNQLPKALLTVDLYGQCCDYTRLESICAQYDVPIIADAAEALGASHAGKKAGGFGLLAAFSFNGNKIITTSGGGMLVSNNENLTKHARFLSTQARNIAPHYEHSELGYNYRMSNLLAAVGRGQLRVLDERVRARRQINAWYRELFGGHSELVLMREAKDNTCSFWLTTLCIKRADAPQAVERVLRALAERDIEARPVWKPMHLQPLYKGFPAVGGSVAETLFSSGVCLPSGSQLTREQVEEISAILLSALG